eukprot:TRINITY_DN17961_c0_g1_i1.p1 TRINITY_DN17961_c0_g1~~TRINITY_DN17961_c0_g1_i1.p1  ORF type:complete len:331 (+),score=85.91 TRINITY_DN17961_c0_g1_i1:83-994(+)
MEPPASSLPPAGRGTLGYDRYAQPRAPPGWALAARGPGAGAAPPDPGGSRSPPPDPGCDLSNGYGQHAGLYPGPPANGAPGGSPPGLEPRNESWSYGRLAAGYDGLWEHLARAMQVHTLAEKYKAERDRWMIAHTEANAKLADQRRLLDQQIQMSQLLQGQVQRLDVQVKLAEQETRSREEKLKADYQQLEIARQKLLQEGNARHRDLLKQTQEVQRLRCEVDALKARCESLTAAVGEAERKREEAERALAARSVQADAQGGGAEAGGEEQPPPSPASSGSSEASTANLFGVTGNLPSHAEDG